MPELIIKYKSKKVLQAILDLAKCFDFSVIYPKQKNQDFTHIKGVTVIPSDSSVDTSGLEDIFTGRNLDAKKLRSNAWQRTK